MQDRDTHARTNWEVMEWICQKIGEIERKKDELDQMLGTLYGMLDYRMALMNDPQEAKSL